MYRCDDLKGMTMDGVVIFTEKNKNLVGKNCWDKNWEIMFKMNEFLKG